MMRSCASCTLSKDISKKRAHYTTSPANSVRFSYVWNVLEFGEYLAELRNILHFDDQSQFCQASIYIHLHIRDVHAFVIEKVGNVAHQALAIIGSNANRNRIRADLRSPVHAHEALAVLQTEPQNVWTVLPMNGRAAPACDVTDDLIAGRGMTTLAHCC